MPRLVHTALAALTGFVLTAGAAAAQPPAIAPPLVVVATTDTGALKGEPAMLAWSPDGSQLYLQGADSDHFGRVKSTTSFLVSLKDRSVKKTDNQPEWASAYWSWKSGHNSPASRSALIDVETRQESVRATSAPTGGSLARGGT